MEEKLNKAITESLENRSPKFEKDWNWISNFQTQKKFELKKQSGGMSDQPVSISVQSILTARVCGKSHFEHITFSF